MISPDARNRFRDNLGRRSRVAYASYYDVSNCILALDVCRCRCDCVYDGICRWHTAKLWQTHA